MKKIIFLFIVLGVNGFLFEQSYSEINIDCKKSHKCETPTKTNPCLALRPQAGMITTHDKPEKGPAQVVVNYFSGVEDYYEPVTFSHYPHAKMAAMSGGCKTCHHFNDKGNILKCIDCHEITRARTDISKPDLKGAFHRQCIDCHREWSGNTECKTCHEKKSEKRKRISAGNEKADMKYPRIIEPKRLVFKTNYNGGKLVTFYHNEHTDTYGIDCGSCHKNESCAKCHDKTGQFKKAPKDINQKHAQCSSCHNVKKNCNFCHWSKTREAFNHFKKSGFNLDRYHSKLSCNKCHKKSGKFKGLNSNCSACHSAWNTTNFKHDITGIALDEIHIENACEDCHIDRNFKVTPSCENCHEADIKYPDSIPGKKVRK